MANVVKAGFLYFLGIFGLGILLGTIRILLLLPNMGPVIAVLIEIPIVLFFAWHLCKWLTGKWAVPHDVNMRLLMGVVAFSCLLMGEIFLAMLLQGGRATDFFLAYDLPENRIGLAGQFASALFPLIQAYGRQIDR